MSTSTTSIVRSRPSYSTTCFTTRCTSSTAACWRSHTQRPATRPCTPCNLHSVATLPLPSRVVQVDCLHRRHHDDRPAAAAGKHGARPRQGRLVDRLWHGAAAAAAGCSSSRGVGCDIAGWGRRCGNGGAARASRARFELAASHKGGHQVISPTTFSVAHAARPGGAGHAFVRHAHERDCARRSPTTILRTLSSSGAAYNFSCCFFLVVAVHLERTRLWHRMDVAAGTVRFRKLV